MTKHTVTIKDNATGKSIECPVHGGTYGPPVIDTKALYKDLGMFTIDPGFMTTASCRSKITYLDGEKGMLLHGGYPIEQLAEHSTYIEVCYLLMYGELPNRKQFEEFDAQVKFRSNVHESVNHMYSGYRHDAHPMSIMVGVMAALSSYYHEAMDLNDTYDRDLTAKRVIAKMPTLAAQCYKYSIGHPFVYPNNSLGYVENFLNMMFSHPMSTYTPDPLAVRALDVLLILHADHEQNASTSTVRLSGSAEANPFACIAAGMVSLWGRAHGGANEAVIHMLREIKTPDNIPKYVARAKDKNDNFRLMGFGHRVYKNFDPRSRVIRKVCYDILESLPNKVDKALFDTALTLEDIALKDEYFIERKLYPNVDFYSGIILKALGIPLGMFTVIFALGRSVGWISQWLELMTDPDFKIGRPRQLYVGPQTRDYIPLNKRA
jgi:citrate synthase